MRRCPSKMVSREANATPENKKCSRRLKTPKPTQKAWVYVYEKPVFIFISQTTESLFSAQSHSLYTELYIIFYIHIYITIEKTLTLNNFWLCMCSSCHIHNFRFHIHIYIFLPKPKFFTTLWYSAPSANFEPRFPNPSTHTPKIQKPSFLAKKFKKWGVWTLSKFFTKHPNFT